MTMQAERGDNPTLTLLFISTNFSTRNPEEFILKFQVHDQRLHGFAK